MSGPTVHATCVVVGSAGVLIRGPSGSGKSTLALELIRMAERDGRFGRLVADDRTRLEASGGRLIASSPPAIAGLAEVRGLGVVTVPILSAAVVRLVVDLVEAPERLPPDEALTTTIAAVALPRLAVAARSANGASLVSQALAPHFYERRCGSYALAFAPQHEKLFPSAPHAPIF